MTKTEPPKGLHDGGQRLWQSVMDLYDLDMHEEILLLQACRTKDLLDRLDDELAITGTLITNTKGDNVTNPAIVESRLQSITLTRLLASLRLPSGETEGGDLVRPQRRGAARGAYGPRSVA